MTSSSRYRPILRLVVILAAGLWLTASQVILRRYNVPDPAAVAAIVETLPAACSQSADQDWVAQVNRLRWVAYSSPRTDPRPGYRPPSAEAIHKDLTTLRRARFNALVTYASPGIMGKDFLVIAESLGFKGIIMGIWNPGNRDEMRNAVQASSSPIVLGFSIGNEGLYEDKDRYTLEQLCVGIADLRAATGLPVTTSEQIDDYDNHPELLFVGDWIFPIAHPYWHSTKYPQQAVTWVRDRYADMDRQTDRFVFLKEQGLPTSGAFALSEENHDLYYRGLERADLPFVYFEGFDQPSKSHTSVEPHWGIFRSTHRPKLLGWNLMGFRRFQSNSAYDGWIQGCPPMQQGCAMNPAGGELYVGTDAGREYRSLLAFSTRLLPDDAVLTLVRLKIRSPGVEGTDPLKGRGRIEVEICRSRLGLDWYLQIAHFGSGLDCHVAGILDGPPQNGWYSLDLTLEGLDHLNRSGTTIFRMSVVNAESVRPSLIKFYSGDAESANRPVLVVRYSIP